MKNSTPRFFYGYTMVAIGFCMMAALWGAFGAFGVFFKPMLEDLGWTRAMTASAYSFSWVIQGMTAIAMGRLNDKLGPRITMTLGGVLLGMGYWLMSQTNTLWQFFLFYGVIVGVGMGAAFVPITSTIARWFLARRSLMMGITMAGGGMGTLLTPPIANQLVASLGWRISYLILGIAVMIVILVAAQFLKRDPSKMGLKPYGIDKSGEQEMTVEVRSLSLREAVVTSQFWLFTGLSFCLGFSAYTIIVHIVPHMIDLGVSDAIAASLLSTVGIGAIAGRLMLGTLADRIGNRNGTAIGFIIMAVAVLPLAGATQLWVIYVLIALFGIAWAAGVTHPPLIADLFGLGAHGVVLGLTTVGYTIGAAVGPVLGGYIFDVTGSYNLAFILSGILGIVGLVLAMLIKPLKDKM